MNIWQWLASLFKKKDPIINPVPVPTPIPVPPPAPKPAPVPPVPTPVPPAVKPAAVVVCPRTPAEYEAKYRAAKLIMSNPDFTKALRVFRETAIKHRKDYVNVADATQLSLICLAGGDESLGWKTVAALHNRESSMNFHTYLHNGDPLFNAKGVPVPTVQVPAHRGPFNPQTWDAGAVDALIHQHGGRFVGKGWTIGDVLKFTEEYNGLGYRNRGLVSPYDWSGTDQYSHGKFTKIKPEEHLKVMRNTDPEVSLLAARPEDGIKMKDHKFNPLLVDKQLGIAAMLKSIEDLK